MSCCNCFVLIAVWAVSCVAFMSNRKRIFAWFWSRLISRGFNPDMAELKSRHFKPLSSMDSKNPELRKENVIKILEIGVGTGSNFKYYPKGTRLVAVDQNPYFASHYHKNRSQFEHIHSKDLIVTTGDKMDMIESNSIDVVVTTIVLCSIDDLGPTLKEIYRVLAPGGKYYLLEHVREVNKDHWVRIFFQHFLTKTGIWGLIGDGCSLTKDILPDVEKAGFDVVEKEYVDIPTGLMFRVARPIMRAVAVK